MNLSKNNFWQRLARLWWVWPVAAFVAVGIGFFFITKGLPDILFWFMLFFLFMQGTTFVAAIAAKDWKRLAGVIFGGLASFMLFIGLLLVSAIGDLMTDDQDTFGKDHPIPDTLQYELPLVDEDMIYYGMGDTIGTFKKAVTPIIDSIDSLTFLQIHEGFQPGIYEYDLHAPALNDGYVFLKCYEATEGIRLSKQEITERTKVRVSSHRAFGQIVSRQEFTIYEGIWDDPYAVRVEAWYHDSTRHKNCLLTSKIYKLEGWMR